MAVPQLVMVLDYEVTPCYIGAADPSMDTLTKIRLRVAKFENRLKPWPEIRDGIVGLQRLLRLANEAYINSHGDIGKVPDCRLIDEEDILHAIMTGSARSISESRCPNPPGIDCVVSGRDLVGLEIEVKVFLPDNENQWCEAVSFILK
jgi:hypothetical protein